jgi:hypothetical protein
MEQHNPPNAYQQPQTMPPALPQKPDQTLAIVSLVLAILSIPGWCCLMYIPLSIGAIITGILALRKVKSGTGAGKGMALAGAIIGGIVLVLFSIAYMVLIVVEVNNPGTF